MPINQALRVVTGPEAVKAMFQTDQEQRRRDQWPFPWLFPPESAEPVFRVNSILAPALGTQVEVLEYSVPAGLQFAFCGIIQLYAGAGFNIGSPDILWTVDTDSPIGVPAIMANPLPGLDQISLPLGGFMGPSGFLGGLAAPWRFEKPFILKPETELRSKATPVQNVSVGDPNYFVTVFTGFTWPS